MAALLGRIANRVLFTRAGQATIATTGATLVASFQVMADSKDFFDYNTEEFLQILGIFPFATKAILAGVVWDAAEENTNTVYNTMRISFDITEKEENIDGEDVVTMFNKRERFVQYVPFTRILLWDQVQNYGYRRLPDGEIEVSHQGESFYGPWPVRMLVGLHARYVIWATEKHINSELFGTDKLEEIEHQRENIPAHVVKEWLASLEVSQQAAVNESRLQGRQSEHSEATLQNLKRLQRHNTTISIERTPGQPGVLSDSVRVKIDDPAAQKAIQDSLKNIKAVQGGNAAAAQLDSLINHKKVLRRNSSLHYGWDDTAGKYKGAFKSRIKRQASTLTAAPDDMMTWRTEARSLRLVEQFNEASDAMSQRPVQHQPMLPTGLDFNTVIEQASHKSCVTEWDAYAQCKNLRKGDHSKCNGWWRSYQHCLDATSPNLVLAALEGIAKYDPDPNIVRLRQ